jgi:hypothetical protein
MNANKDECHAALASMKKLLNDFYNEVDQLRWKLETEKENKRVAVFTSHLFQAPIFPLPRSLSALAILRIFIHLSVSDLHQLACLTKRASEVGTPFRKSRDPASPKAAERKTVDPVSVIA